MNSFLNNVKCRDDSRTTDETLQKIRETELASLTDEEARSIIEYLRKEGISSDEKLDWLGMVVMQAIFKRSWTNEQIAKISNGIEIPNREGKGN